MEHTTLHLLYYASGTSSYDHGLVPTPERIGRVAQGIILAEDGSKMSKVLVTLLTQLISDSLWCRCDATDDCFWRRMT